MNQDEATFDQDLEDAWGEDEEMDTGTDQADTQTETETQEQTTEAAQEETAEADTSEQTADQQPDTYLLRNRDETRTVGRDEVIAMAQKGWDYDNVRQERDQLREYRQQADPAMALVSSYAQRAGMTIENYIDYCRKQEIMATGVDEANANAQVQNEKWQAQREAQTRADQEAAEVQRRAREAEQKRAETRQADLERFVHTYPGVNPNDIGKDVWANVAAGETLTSAYMRAENQRLKAELDAIKQNQKNQTAAPGSLGGNAAAEMDEIDRIWAEDD